ncbi:unnamed protein product [Ceutorhynchus assimilis]|uniref:Proline-rich nuclear receptor coactivator 2 n=1 Tax=Ceutorhynchus assimilis TaxID=467358 RepID=A0A9P0GSK9_9CUCU|nr:unnamed protein product [Ceutorhynchus assimilis]
MTMTKKPDIKSKIVGQSKARGAKNHLTKNNLGGSPTFEDSFNNRQGGSPTRMSPVKGSPPRSPVAFQPSLRSSPGLLAGHYAGCKFTEPPSASALPLPPPHWMQSQSKKSVILPFRAIIPLPVDQNHDFSQQLKLLLQVQA